jgi:hypothetical protein
MRATNIPGGGMVLIPSRRMGKSAATQRQLIQWLKRHPRGTVVERRSGIIVVEKYANAEGAEFPSSRAR